MTTVLLPTTIYYNIHISPIYQGMMLTQKELVYCMTSIDSSLVLLGTNMGVVYVYDGYDQKLKHKLAPLGDSVLCLLHFK